MDPTKRVTSEVAMADPYFAEDPRPSAEYVCILSAHLICYSTLLCTCMYIHVQ